MVKNYGLIVVKGKTSGVFYFIKYLFIYIMYTIISNSLELETDIVNMKTVKLN